MAAIRRTGEEWTPGASLPQSTDPPMWPCALPVMTTPKMVDPTWKDESSTSCVRLTIANEPRRASVNGAPSTPFACWAALQYSASDTRCNHALNSSYVNALPGPARRLRRSLQRRSSETSVAPIERAD